MDQVGSAKAELSRVASRSAAQMAGENFPVALRILPRDPRDKLARFYGYARFVDDVGDESAGDRLALLDVVEADIRSLVGGTPALAPVAALLPLVRDSGVPIQPFLDLVEANRMDQRVSTYPTFADLLGYCRLSAAPVGRVVLHVAGAATEDNIADSDEVCAGLQVLEHCQDVGEDSRAGRVYLPADDLAAAGVTAQMLEADRASRALRRAVALQVERAVPLLYSGRRLIGRLHGWSRLAVSGYVGGGLATADALRAADCDVLTRHVGPSTARTAAHAIRLATGR